MGTIVFLIITLFLFFIGKKKLSLLLFCAMSYEYFALLPSSLMTLNGIDGAIVYMIIVSVANYGGKRKIVVEDPKLRRRINAFAIFLILSIAFSLLHHHLTVKQVFMGVRLHFIFLSYFFLRSVPEDDILWIVRVLYNITLIHAIVYIIQFATGLPLLGVTAKMDELSGKYRFLNFPRFNIFFLFLSLLYPKFLNSNTTHWSPAVFLGVQLCTLGRTSIIATFIVLLIALAEKLGSINKHNKRLLVGSLILILVIIPLYGMIFSRIDNDGKTIEDIKDVFSGEAFEAAIIGTVDGNKTFSYRIAWVLERGIYMLSNSWSESIFGLGFFAPKDNALAYATYHFAIGLPDDDGINSQLLTPDISYGNIITQFGFLGGCIYMLIWFRMLNINYINRNNNPLCHAMSLFIIYVMLESFAETHVYVASHMVFPFMITRLAFANNLNK